MDVAREAISMGRHDKPVEHTPRRRWIPLLKPKRCRCGEQLPCYVKATHDQLSIFHSSARPAWNGPTQVQRPLMTPAQLHRSRQDRYR